MSSCIIVRTHFRRVDGAALRNLKAARGDENEEKVSWNRWGKFGNSSNQKKVKMPCTRDWWTVTWLLGFVVQAAAVDDERAVVAGKEGGCYTSSLTHSRAVSSSLAEETTPHGISSTCRAHATLPRAQTTARVNHETIPCALLLRKRQCLDICVGCHWRWYWGGRGVRLRTCVALRCAGVALSRHSATLTTEHTTGRRRSASSNRNDGHI
ncbi:hypothetical protein BC567DRAFT_88022 [Phyllosticta citribraziliensis]